ncbi:hypothetical protein F5Y16DRAFT_362557 [Xylariaceae sp. FL0255]|nr:hypothetical protein F5Y16DRAFT_362557 [Xylariaceae sp. FL0255]
MSLAAFRRSEQHDELGRLAKEHMQNDLEPSDRDVLSKAASRIATPTTIGTLVGLGLGVYAAFRLRKLRGDVFTSFRASERPSHVVFSNGRQEPVPDMTPYLRPTTFGDVATYFFFGLGGTILGGELGLLLGTWSASRTISRDPARKARIEKAYRLFKADVLRKEADQLEKGVAELKF